MNVDPIVMKSVAVFQDQHHGQEIAVFERIGGALCLFGNGGLETVDQFAHRGRGNNVFGFEGMFLSILVAIDCRPRPVSVIVLAPDNAAAHFERAAQCLGFFCARLPHHSRTAPRILEGIDQRLDHFRAVFRTALREKRVADRAA